MRGCLLILAIFAVSFLPAPADAAPVPSTWVSLGRNAPDGRTPWSVQLQRLEGDLVRIELTLGGFHRIPMDGSRFEQIQVPGAGTTRIPGLPALPVLQQRLLGSAGDTPQILGVEVDTVLVQDVVPAPHTPRPKRCGGEWPDRITCDTDWYASGEAFPEAWATVRRAGLLRSIPVVELSFSPFRYHPVTHKLEVARRVTVTLSLSPLDRAALPVRAFSRPFVEEVKRAFLDPFPLLRGGPVGAPERLLVLAHDDLAPAMEDFVTWKRHTGLDVDLVPLSAVGSSWQDVADYLNEQYHDAPVAPTYVLLVGDGEGPTTVPFVPSPLGCASDFLFTTVEGGDLYSDFLIGRFSADAAADATLQAEKVIWYERDLAPKAGTWIPKSICISSSQGSGDSNDDVRSDIICGIQNGAGYETTKFYNSLGNDTAANVSNAINEGLGWVTYLGHGSGSSWATTTPAFSNSHISQLDNVEMLPVIMDVSCSNGQFDGGGGDCFAEAWLKTGESGNMRAAIGSYSASTSAAWDEPAEMAIGFAKGLLEEDISRYGEACLFARGYMMDVLPGYGSIEEVCHQYVIFGDPSLRLRTEVPWTPEVQIPDVIPVGLPSMEVSVTRDGVPLEGASVVVRKDEEFYTAALTGPDGLAAVAIAPQSPGTAEVWVTAANAATWEGTVQVSATGCGVLLANLDVAGCEASLSLSLFDQDLNLNAEQAETVQVLAASSGAPAAPVTVILTENGMDNSTFVGVLGLTPVLHQGELVVSHGETVAVVYADADCDGAAAEAAVQVPVDCQAPVISEVAIEDITAGSAEIHFLTDEPAAVLALFGVEAPPTTEVNGSAGNLTHQISLGPLEPSTTYLVEIQATDPAGNVAVDNAGGAYHVFDTPDCTPQCDGKQCGDNGCDGICGTCCPDQTCNDGVCAGGAGCEPSNGASCGGCPCEECVCAMDEYCCTGQWDEICVSECVEHCGGCPSEGDCTGKECGDDGCGGSCGDCLGGEECVLGQCGTPCVPDCQGKECGDDDCGGSCGDCPEGTTCSEDQECLDPCYGVGFEGCCDGATLHYCEEDHVMQVDCGTQGLVCGWLDNLGWYGCTDEALEDPSGEHPLWCKGACKPGCAGKECGSDGCGGDCGDCPTGDTCGEDGFCHPSCPDLPPGGCCDEDILVYCDLLLGADAQADCTKDNLHCGWDPTLNMYNCVETQGSDPSGSHPLWCPGTCTPDCADKSCGDDGCGGTCGSCVPGFTCGENYTCTLKTGSKDVVETDGGENGGGQAPSSTGCGAGPATAPPWWTMMLLAITVLVSISVRKGVPHA